MGDITKNFDRKEFACHGEGCCGHSAPISIKLVHALQELRDIAGMLVVDCGFRCNMHNAAISHAQNSQHPLGTAADIRSPYHTPDLLADMAETVGLFYRGGIGIYNWGIHVDIRTDGSARWRENET